MKRWAAFAALCVIQGFAWIPLEHSGSGITAASCALGAALAALCIMWFSQHGRVSVVGVCCVLLGPWLCLLLGDRAPGAGAVALALTLVPVVVAVVASALGMGEFSPTKLWPGLAAAAALMIVAPLPGLSDWRVDVVLCLIPMVTGIGCALLKQDQASQRDPAASVGIVAGLFLLLAIVQAAVWHVPLGISLVPVLVCAAVFTLEILALQRLSATQYSAQFAVVPLLALLQGPMVIGRGVVSWRFGVSVLLLTVASVALVRDSEENVG